jgi:hypothetical protein
MKLKSVTFCAVVCALGVAAACGKSPTSPASPSSTGVVSTDAAADGSTLKVTAPTNQAPPNGQRLEIPEGFALTVANGSSKFGASAAYTYRFQVLNAANQIVINAGGVPQGGGTTSYVVNQALEGDQTYIYRARVEMGSEFGPWSTATSFVIPVSDGYIRGNELYDPLVNGRTVGAMNGPMSFIPGVGLRFYSQLSYVAYQLPQTLREGEFSLITSDMDKNTDGDKTKLFSMAQGFDDIVTNDRRMTVEKRGDPAGVVAWRFITHHDQVDTEGPEREEVNFRRDRSYFWQATWRGNVFRVLIREGGVDGPTIYNKAKSFVGDAYDPNPHVIYLGAPVGRSGESGASVDNVTYRQIWVSGRPRPAFANK